MKMKRIWAFVLCLAMLFTLAACAGSAPQGSASAVPSDPVENPSAASAPKTPSSSDAGTGAADDAPDPASPSGDEPAAKAPAPADDVRAWLDALGAAE